MADKKRETNGSAQGRAATGPWRFVRYILVLILLGAVTLSWVSLLTYNPVDNAASAIQNPPRPPSNLAGRAGAEIACFLRYWLGGGAYMGLLFATVAAFIMVLGGKVKDLPWRIIGLMLMVTATSAAIYLINPTPDRGADVVNGPAGILGVGVGQFLEFKFGKGAWIILGVTMCIGLMLTADNLVLQVPRLGRKVWDRRGEVASAFGALRPSASAAPSGQAPGATPRGIALSAGKLTGPEQAGKKGIVTGPAPAIAAAAQGKALEPARPILQPTAKGAGPQEPAFGDRVRVSTAVLAPSGLAVTVARPASPSQDVLTLKPPPKFAPAKPAGDKPAAAKDGRRDFVLPSADLLAEPSGGYLESQEAAAEQKRAVLQQTLNDFNVQAQVVGHTTGPVITMYELELAPGVKVAQVENLAKDIARALAVPGVRVVSPITGKDTIGIEVPNLQKQIVRIKELMNLAPDADKTMRLPLYLGKDAAGAAIVADLANMPHMLIAGTTGSGKSVSINAIIISLLMTRRPEEVRLILVDPKMVEMAAFENMPHLLCPIVNDMRRAEDILEWAAEKMDERYELFKEAGVKNIAAFNRLSKEEIHRRFEVENEEERSRIPTHLGYYVIIIDELADLIMTSSKEVEGHIIRIAQKARAVGIHMILATQRPSANVVTSLIKSNMPCRISFRVASRLESRIVLDQNGADVLLGQGDMLFLQPGTSNLIRAQGAYVDDAEIRSIVETLRKSGQPQYSGELLQLGASPSGDGSGQRDEMFSQAVEIVLATQRGSVSLLQRRLQVGYSRASRIIDQMAEAGILGDYKGSQARECLMTLEDWQAFQKSVAADQSGASAANGQPTSS